MSHSDLLDGVLPAALTARDLPSETTPAKARTAVAKLVCEFMLQQATQTAGSSALLTLAAQHAADHFAPFEEMFVEQEGSWWWTGNADEAGHSAWAASAQERMAGELPEGYGGWYAGNDFHLLSDESGIPPYYRSKHRANVSLAGTSFRSLNVAQLRYVELTKGGKGTLEPPLIAEDGYRIIKEEKAGVLQAIADDGKDFTSAIEIATKMASRQFVFSLTGAPAPETLDQGSRCQPINEAAWSFAWNRSSTGARARFGARGRPLKMVADTVPKPDGGPWFIWNYLQFADKQTHVEVQSWSSFTPLDGLAYGAGTHYCKLLSPARVLEWIYTDGLRRAASATQQRRAASATQQS
jgi:hypothetical protein